MYKIICQNKILPFVVILISNLAFTQVSNDILINEKNILKLFKSTINQENRNQISVPSNPWSTDAEKFTKSDTIEMINPSNGVTNKYCNVINWTFYRKDKFKRSFGNYCQEPPYEKVGTINDFFDLKVKKIDKKVIIELYNQEKLVEKFEVISLIKTQSLDYRNEFQYLLKLNKVK